MAVIPNYYFQSPSIEAASRNLASALMPPDPEKTLMAQRAKWMFAREQERAQIEDEDRRKADLGDAAIAELFAGGEAPTPATSPGQAAYFSQNPGAAGGGMPDDVFKQNIDTAFAGGRSMADVVQAAGPRGAAFLKLAALQDDKQLAAMGLQKLRSGTSFDIAQMGQSGAYDRAMLGYEKALELQKRNAELEKFIQLLKGQQAEAHDDRTVTNKPPTKISPTEGRDMRYGVEDWAANLVGKNLAGKDYQLPGDVLDAVVNYENDIYRQTNDAPNAQDEALKFFFGENPKATAAEDTVWLNPLTRDTEASLQLRDGKTLGELMAELAQIKAAATQGAPAAPGGVPPMIAAPGSQVQRVPVHSPGEARLLPPNTPFIVLPEGRTGTTPPVPFR